ncbi:MAG: hypothetical protein ACYC9M_14105 [Desulfobulbaceae bacterium]
MIHRRRFLKLIAGGLVASQIPATLLTGWGTAVALPGEEPNVRKGNFQFDDIPDRELRAVLLSVDGTAEQVIRHLSASATCFEPLLCAEEDGQLAAVDAIHNLDINGTVVDVLYLFAQGRSENLPRVTELAVAGRSSGLFTVAMIIETQDTDANQWAKVCTEAGVDSLNLISPAALGPDAAIQGPQFAHQPFELACLIALRSQTEYFRVWSIIGIDFADYKIIVGGRRTVRLGIGSATGATRGAVATHMAMDALKQQGVTFQSCWVMIFGGNDCTMEDFDEVSRVFHGRVREDADYTIGLFPEEELAETLTVTILAG